MWISKCNSLVQFLNCIICVITPGKKGLSKGRQYQVAQVAASRALQRYLSPQAVGRYWSGQDGRRSVRHTHVRNYVRAADEGSSAQFETAASVASHL